MNILVAASVLVALAVFALFFFFYIWTSHRDHFVAEQHLLARLTANNCSAAIDFNDDLDSQANLNTLSEDKRVLNAALVLDGTVFVRYDREEVLEVPDLDANGPTWFDDGLHVVERIPSHKPATLYVRLDTSPMMARMRTAALLYILGSMLSSLMALLIARRLKQKIVRPFSSLADAVKQVADQANYSVRAPVHEEDEIGVLTRQFNDMIELIQRRDSDLASNIKRLQTAIQEKRDAEEKEARAHERLERAKRLESIGILAGGVAHDLNNLLGPIVAYPAMIKEDFPGEEALAEDLDEIERAARQATALIRDLLTLARRGNFKEVPVDTGDAVGDYMESPATRKLVTENVNIDLLVDVEENLPIISGSKAHLNQVIMNTVQNAFAAIGDEDGEVRLSVKACQLARSLTGYEEVPAGTYIKLSVADTGKGMPHEVVRKIFEPFFSTKNMGNTQGSGLGLAICYSVVKDMKGFVDVQSRSGEGTRFDFYFPVTQAIPRDAVPHSGSGIKGTERVLVVDDLHEQRTLMLRILTSFGYDVHTCSSAEEAMVWLDENDCDIILLDMMLGEGLNGCEATHAILARFPGMPILLVSGYAPDGLVKDALANGARSFVSKPYLPEALAKEVRKNLTTEDIEAALR